MNLYLRQGMIIQQYIDNINKRYKLGNATEHTFRGDLQQLIESIVSDVSATNEPKRISCGAPDYIIMRKEVPVGYIEAKDIGVDLNHKSLKEQFERYKASLSNLIFTDYIDFHFYKEGVFITKIAIAEIIGNQIVAKPENFDTFTNLLINFSKTITQTIKSPTKLAEMMAGKARLMADVIEKSLNDDDEHEIVSPLKSQMQAFKDMLIHDIDNKAFSDIYAQTIAYGMFAARYHDPTLPTFSRQEAATLIPKSNPFLRKLFNEIAGIDLDDRLLWIVEELVSVFLASDVADIMRNFGKSTKQEDPVVHFYETFLAAYNPALRKARGVWYTPQPVVNFIVRAVDDILKTEFNLKDGLADTSKTKIKVKVATKATADRRSVVKEELVEQEVHKVQILDPATGTGTFLAEVVRHIYKKFEGQQGIWNSYVEQHLIPRLNGFELLMASYAMAHLKMDMLLTETGFKATKEQRTRIFLTNSLEESHADAGTLFASWLSDEANQANNIKRDTPVMVVMGNPPYSVSSTNKSPWIEKLTADYKKDMKERNIQPLSDDYIKFIRFGQHFIDKNGEGVLAYISNNSFIDGIIHRQMRKHLLESFDKIYILDLHGNAKKKEVCEDGSADQNVFDIMQGVSINIFVKTGRKKNDTLGEVFHYDIHGKREVKYEFLNLNQLKNINWNKIILNEPHFYLVKKDFSEEKIYNKGFEVVKLFEFKSSGIKTHDDENLIADNLIKLESNIIKLKHSFDLTKVYQYCYRPFDIESIYYDTKILGRAREKTISHLKYKNLGLILVAQPQAANLNYFDCIFIANCLTDTNMFRRGGPSVFPLYLYPEKTDQTSTEEIAARKANLNEAIMEKIAKDLNLAYIEDDNIVVDLAAGYSGTLYPTDILDYIYAVLHSPSYREKYKEFLKIDFPRVPYPKDLQSFENLVSLGTQLRQLHLLEGEIVNKPITKYPVSGNNVVDKIKFEHTAHHAELVSGTKLLKQVQHDDKISQHDDDAKGIVHINETQYFIDVPESAWNFYIGGYQPAQKWLKDRKGRALSFEDIMHYQKIIVALNETDRLMKEIDKVGME